MPDECPPPPRGRGQQGTRCLPCLSHVSVATDLVLPFDSLTLHAVSRFVFIAVEVAMLGAEQFWISGKIAAFPVDDKVQPRPDGCHSLAQPAASLQLLSVGAGGRLILNDPA